MYAASGMVGAYVGDFPTSDPAALDDDGSIQGALSFGGPAAQPVGTPIVGTTTGVNVNLRSGPSTKYRVITKLPKATKLEVIGHQAGWYRVATSRGTVGWVIDDFLSVATAPSAASVPTKSVSAKLNANSVNLRQGPHTRYASYGKLAKGVQVTVLGRVDGWYQVRSPRGTIGWIAADLLTISSAAAQAVPVTTNVPALPSVQADRAAAAPIQQQSVPAVLSSDAGRLALRYVGTRYVWGGTSPRGFDCSGLVQYVYRQLGVSLPRTARQQFSQARGQRINNLGSLAPGDLVFFVRTTSARGITHVGMYVGNGMMVTANSPSTGVQKVSVYGKYWRSRFAGAVRPSR
jgi:cell wall-associated NlpC family hydrolase